MRWARRLHRRTPPPRHVRKFAIEVHLPGCRLNWLGWISSMTGSAQSPRGSMSVPGVGPVHLHFAPSCSAELASQLWIPRS